MKLVKSYINSRTKTGVLDTLLTISKENNDMFEAIKVYFLEAHKIIITNCLLKNQTLTVFCSSPGNLFLMKSNKKQIKITLESTLNLYLDDLIFAVQPSRL